ncbi:unnamed protein product [Amoebophrya sp. A120]|nr:unnamed protein product [Amoebophrya sp. A120]|eukprot:GSA120T00017598001.1
MGNRFSRSGADQGRTQQLMEPADQQSGARSVAFRDQVLAEQNGALQPDQPPGFLKRHFPHLRWRSVQGVCIVLECVIFLIACLVITPRGYITPEPLANWKLGSSDRTMEQCAYVLQDKYWIELRRMIVPIFLHGNIPHILMSLYFQFSEGTTTEAEFGPVKFFIVFLVTGISGNLLSDAFGVNGVGASTSCYGLIGVQVGRLFVVEWPHIEDMQLKTRLHEHWMRVVGMLAAWEILNWSTIDHYGHLGGFLGGMCLGCVLQKHTSIRFTPLSDQRLFDANNPQQMVAPTKKQRAWASVVLFVLMFGSAGRIYWSSSVTELEMLCPMMWQRYFMEQ